MDDVEPAGDQHGPRVKPQVGAAPILRMRGAEVRFAPRSPSLWSGLDLDVDPGEWVAVLGGNGSGKTTLMRCLLGLLPLTAGTIEIGGLDLRAGRRHIGYVPQQRRIDPLVPLRARDQVGFGLDGDRWGLRGRGAGRRATVDAALAAVGAAHLADQPMGRLSGGQQQLVRIAQALAGDPRLLLCDEPLLSLDLRHQSAVVAAVDRRRTEHATSVLFVTHEINPVLPYVDRVLYLAGERFSIGTVDEVMTSQTLSALYGVPVQVLHREGQIFVLGVPAATSAQHPHADDLISLP